jgi:hypothetical protein
LVYEAGNIETIRLKHGSFHPWCRNTKAPELPGAFVNDSIMHFKQVKGQWR